MAFTYKVLNRLLPLYIDFEINRQNKQRAIKLMIPKPAITVLGAVACNWHFSVE